MLLPQFHNFAYLFGSSQIADVASLISVDIEISIAGSPVRLPSKEAMGNGGVSQVRANSRSGAVSWLSAARRAAT